MSEEGLRLVLDASVVIKLLVEEPLSDRVDRLFDLLADSSDHQFFVPDLLYIECSNILWKYTRRFGLPETEAKKKLEEIYALDFDVIPILGYLPNALEAALKHEISVYDGCYIAVADFLKAPLVTADEKLIAKMSEGTTTLLSLAEMEMPEAE
ncbi:MAG: type II toxin-antitoxin system VapC family toxin [Candidatus Omnitrophica bacterium]|nr:type II toxin-antitoxin system VapC family toxin [Candidatus Omnitrophota bacterium]